MKVAKWDVYPGYLVDSNSIPVNDIAILTLEIPVKFSKFVQPVCLPKLESLNMKEEELFTISGWGNTAAGWVKERPAKVLQFLLVEKVEHQECNEILNK